MRIQQGSFHMIRRISMCALAAMLVMGCTENRNHATTQNSSGKQTSDLVESAPGGPANEITAPSRGDYGLFKLDDNSGEFDKGPAARWPLNAGDRLGFTDSPTDVKAKPGRYAVAGTAEFAIDPSHHFVWRKLHGSYRNAFPFP
jgi:hypothetical protein